MMNGSIPNFANNWGQMPSAPQGQGFPMGNYASPVAMPQQAQPGFMPTLDFSSKMLGNIDTGMPLNAPIPNVAGGGAGGAPGGGFWGNMLGKTSPDGTKTQGWGGLALGAFSGLANTYMGLQQYKLAKDSFNQNRREFDLNFAAQKQTTNTALEDRQRARVSASPQSYQSVDSYMAKNGVKG